MKRRSLFVLSLSLTFWILGANPAAPLTPYQPLAAIESDSSLPKPDVNALAKGFGKLPLSFEANAGQTDQRVRFLSRGQGYTLFLTGNEAVLASPKAPVAPGAGSTNRVLRMKLVGANGDAAVTGAEELPGKSNYFIGKDSSKWRTNVPTYAQVKYPSVYPGVDLIYYGAQGGQLEYDFVVAPGADPSAIKLKIAADTHGVTRAKRRVPLRIASDGDLVVKADGAEIRMHKPVVYQNEANGAELGSENGRAVRQGHFVLMASNQVGFAVGPYDHAKPLIIDPVFRSRRSMPQAARLSSPLISAAIVLVSPIRPVKSRLSRSPSTPPAIFT